MIKFDSTVQLEMLNDALEAVRGQDVGQMRPSVDERALQGIKFVDCLEESLAIQMLESRLSDPASTLAVIEQNRRLIAV